MKVVDSVARRETLAILAIGLIALATWLPRLGGPIDLRWDADAYYLLGTSLAHGEGYRLPSEPGRLESSLHPPLLPALVAAHQLLLGTADFLVVGQALRITMMLVSIAYSIATFVFLTRHVPRRYAFAATVLGAVQPVYLYFSDALFAESLYSLATVAFFIFHETAPRKKVSFAACAVCAVIAYEARTAGMALLVAWVVSSILRKDFRRGLLALVLTLVAVLGWTAWIRAVEASPAYQHPAYAYQTAPYLHYNVSYARNIFTLVDPWVPERGPLTAHDLAVRVWTNLQTMPMAIGQAVSTWITRSRFALPLALLVLLGVGELARRRLWLVLLYVALSLAAMCVTPFPSQFARYLMPLYAFFALAICAWLARMASGHGAIGSRLPAYLRHAFPVAVAAALAYHLYKVDRDLFDRHHNGVAFLHDGRRTSFNWFHYGPEAAEFDAALDWLRQRADPGDVVASQDPQWVYLRIGRMAVLPPFEVEGRKAQRLLDTVPVRYLVAPSQGNLYHRFTAALLHDNPQAWNRIWRSETGVFEVYERFRPAGDATVARPSDAVKQQGDRSR